MIEPEDAAQYLPNKKSDLDKYSAGKVLVIAGSYSMPGAALFSMNAAMNSGAGSGFLAFPKSALNLVQTQMNSAISFGYEDDGKGILSKVPSKLTTAPVMNIRSGFPPPRLSITIPKIRVPIQKRIGIPNPRNPENIIIKISSASTMSPLVS